MPLLHRGCTCRDSRCLLFLSRAFKAINQFISLGHWLSTEVCFACRGFSCAVQSSGDIFLSPPGAEQEEEQQEYPGAHPAKLKLSGVSRRIVLGCSFHLTNVLPRAVPWACCCWSGSKHMQTTRIDLGWGELPFSPVLLLSWGF